MHLVYGRVRKVHPKARIFEILKRNKIEYYYLSRSQMKKFNSYLQEGLFVYFNVSDELVLRGKYRAYEIINFVKLIRHRKRKPVVFFDLSTIKRGVSKIVNRPQYRMFLDMEFTMPPYNYDSGQPFASEVIQYGYYLEDESGAVIDSNGALLKPVNKIGLNDRTFSFLSLKRSDFKKAKSFKSFYDDLKEVIETYTPTIYVWGKNDIFVLEKISFPNRVTDLFLRRQTKDIFTECGIDPESEILIADQEPNPIPDRKALDDIVFDFLGLTEDERKEVYRAVCQLVWERISKARSVGRNG